MKKSKVFASCIATTIVAASITSISANAVKIPGINSNFEYELSITPISNSEAVLKFFTTSNPGVSNLSVALVYDPAKFDAVKCAPGYDLASGSHIIPSYGNNLETGVFIASGILYDDNSEPQYSDYTGNIEFNFYIKADDGDITDEDISQFAVSVLAYTSKNECINNYKKPNYDPSIDLPEAVVDRLDYQYIIGDTDDSGRNSNGELDPSQAIDLSDVTNISTLASYANSCNVDPTVSNLNQKIYNNDTSAFSNGSTFAWGNVFNYFMRNVNDISFSCVECADANKDNYITQEDANIVINWYAQIGSQIPAKDLLEIADKIIYF